MTRVRSILVVADEFERCAGEPTHDTTAAGFCRRPGSSAVFVLKSDDINLENVTSSNDKVGDGSDSLPRRPFRFNVVVLDRRDFWRRVSTVCDESGSAVLDSGRPVHHLERRVAHLCELFLQGSKEMLKLRNAERSKQHIVMIGVAEQQRMAGRFRSGAERRK